MRSLGPTGTRVLGTALRIAMALSYTLASFWLMAVAVRVNGCGGGLDIVCSPLPWLVSEVSELHVYVYPGSLAVNVGILASLWWLMLTRGPRRVIRTLGRGRIAVPVALFGVTVSACLLPLIIERFVRPESIHHMIASIPFDARVARILPIPHWFPMIAGLVLMRCTGICPL